MTGLLKVVDKDSLLRAVVFAKAKADLEFFNLKWKGSEQHIDDQDKDNIKKIHGLHRSIRANVNDCQRKYVERFAAEIRLSLKNSYDLEDVKAIQRSLNEIHGRHAYRIHLFEIADSECIHLWSGASPSQRNILIITQNGEFHVCGAFEYCSNCCRHVEPIKTHACFTRMPTEAMKKKYKEKEKTVKVIAFDLECSQSIEKEDGTFEFLENHEVVCAVAKKACYECFEVRRFNKNVDCVKCGRNKVVFSYCNTENIFDEFIDWLFRPEHNGSYLFAHYGGRYDYLLLLQGMLKLKIKPDVIMNGRRVIAGTAVHNECTLYLRDSFNLIPLALGNFKKAFGLKSCDDKGEFPFLLIEQRWFHQSIPHMPALKYYGIDGKSEEKREEFLKWYNSHDPDYVFEFNEELISYCEKDVDLLLMGLIEYRHAMMKLTSWDPIPAVCTLPAFTSFILRCDHIKPRQLCNFPDNGFSFNRQQSPIAIKWIKGQMEKTGEHIQHVENGGEVKIELPGLTTFVDGYCVRKSDGAVVIYEFLGSFWHGDPRCFSPHQVNKVCQQSYGTLHEMAMDRLKKLEAAYTVIYAWEFDVKKELAKNKEMRDFFNNCESSRLVLRTSMQGGRTEAHARIAKSTTDKKLVYYDINSLYPTVMSTCDLPVGPAEVKRDGFPPVPSREFNFTGLGHIRILPPRHLRYPLLGIKMNNTLLFCLCKLCGSKKSSATCNHKDNERSIVGTWSHREIQKALSLGYVILAYYEIWIFKKFSNTIFKDYIKTFYTVKISSSGWPKWVKTADDKKKCLQNYKDTMGIELTEDQIQDNPSLRSVSKMLLNTSWGKFAQNPNVKKTIFCDADEMGDLLDTKLHQISTYYKLNNDLFIVSLAMNDEEIHSCPFGNVPLACYVTSEARLILYSMLEASNGAALYNDTDSIIALIPRDPNLNPFKFMLGDGLGKLTDETHGKLIKKALFGGAKQYGLQLEDEKTGKISYVIKVRGLCLDYAARKILTFKKFKSLIKKGTSIETKRINLKRKAMGIKTIQEKKVYKAVNEKGFHIYGKVFPFGYNYAHEEEPLEYDDSEESEESEREETTTEIQIA